MGRRYAAYIRVYPRTGKIGISLHSFKYLPWSESSLAQAVTAAPFGSVASEVVTTEPMALRARGRAFVFLFATRHCQRLFA